MDLNLNENNYYQVQEVDKEYQKQKSSNNLRIIKYLITRIKISMINYFSNDDTVFPKLNHHTKCLWG